MRIVRNFIAMGYLMPAPSRRENIDLNKLKQIVEVAESIADEQQLAKSLSQDVIDADSQLMKRPESAWVQAEGLGNDELICLIRFFTLAEMQLTGWDGGKYSPVIYLVRILKSRAGFDSELRRWIKSHTDNRFLPNGAVL